MTDYYVLSPLGPHNTGDVLSFSPEQIGAGVDITHLTSIGAIRVATPLLAPPLAPTLATAGTGGTVAAGVYTVKISYVTASGETTPSPSTTQTTSGATSTLTVNSPAPATDATGWYAYVSQVGGSTLTRQQTSPTAIATNLVLTAPPTSNGPAPRSTNTSGEAARSVPAQIQAIHAPPGVGVFAINGSPVNGPAGSYATIAAYGSVLIDASVSPPAFYTNLGTIASPTWTAAGGVSYPGVTSDNSDGVITIGNVRAASFYQSAFSTQTIYDTVVAPRVGSGPAAGTYKYFIAIGNALGPSNFINGYGVIAVDGSHSVTADFDPAEVIGSDVTHIYLYRGLRNAAGGPFYLADSMAYPSLNSTTFVLNQLLDTSTDASIVANPLYPAYDQSLAHSIIGPIDVQGAVGEFGASAPSTQAVITGNVTTGSLANLQTVVGQLLTALDAKGAVKKSTS